MEDLITLEQHQIVLASIEMHICVAQTAASLLEAGYEVFVSYATASHSVASEQACLQRLSAASFGIVTKEMVAFDRLGKTSTPSFKKMLPKVK